MDAKLRRLINGLHTEITDAEFEYKKVEILDYLDRVK